MRFFRLLAITVLLLACVVLGSACAGAKGEQGADGVGIQSVANNTDGTITIYLTNGQSYTTGDLTGLQGEQGIQGIQGVKGDQGAQGIQGPAGPSMIVAMGVINQSAQIVEGYNVASCEWKSNYYDIALTGITYSADDYVTSGTPIFSLNGHFATYSFDDQNHLVVIMKDAEGATGQSSFSFMVLDPTP